MMRVTGLFLLACAVTAQSPLAPLKGLEGQWKGTTKGQPGIGQTERSYEFVLNGRFLYAKNAAAYAPTEKNPKGEFHEDRGFISYDQARKVLVWRQFHGEGFVNQYVAPITRNEDRTIVFTSEAIENIPSGWRARETWRFVGPDEFIETFELSAPGKDFEVYSESRFLRRR
jgi:hypothetical protein